MIEQKNLSKIKILEEKINDVLNLKILELKKNLDELTILIDKKDLLEVTQLLKNSQQLQFNQMMDLTAVDYLNHNHKFRFQVVYHFLSLSQQQRLRLKCLVSEKDLTIDSISSIFDAADWYERECYDMYGILFRGHPDLKRILLYEEFKGHPLRKDYLITKEQPLIPVKEIKERYPYMKNLSL